MEGGSNKGHTDNKCNDGPDMYIKGMHQGVGVTK